MDNLDQVPAGSSSNSATMSSKVIYNATDIPVPPLVPSTNGSNSSSPGYNVFDIRKMDKYGGIPTFRIVDKYGIQAQVKLKALEKEAKAKRAAEENIISEQVKRKKGELYADNKGYTWHKIVNTMITPPIITENLPLQFKDLPITGAPKCSEKLEEFQNKKLREFMGADLDDAEFAELQRHCNPAGLKTGKELIMSTRVPVMGLLARNLQIQPFTGEEETSDNEVEIETKAEELITLQRLRMRQKMDANNVYPRGLKYRGVKLLPLEEQENKIAGIKSMPPDLEPGKDLVFRIRVYRPFKFHLTGEKHVRGRHSVFYCDIVMHGRQKLTALRDQFTCRNDVDMRLDMSERPDEPCNARAKDVFPSGFLFINNVFYVDKRARCVDHTAVLRRWAASSGIGTFPVRSLEDYRLDQILVKLAHPDVYVHQGSCEHVFLFSEVRLAATRDALHGAAYPCHTALSQNQTIYCTSCAEFGAKWLVTGTARVPFDPAFFCETCFKQYLYVDGEKIGRFKAYAYRGNEINLKSTANS